MQFLVGRFQLLDGGLQVFPGELQLLLQIVDALLDLLAKIVHLRFVAAPILQPRGQIFDEDRRQQLLPAFSRQWADADLHRFGFVAPFGADAGVFQLLAGLEHFLQAGGQRDGQILGGDLGDVVDQLAGGQAEVTFRVAEDVQYFQLLVDYHHQRQVIADQRL